MENTINIKEFFKKVNKQQKDLNNTIRETLVEYLRNEPDRTANLCDNPAYCLIEGTACWLEDTVCGIRLDEHDNLELALDIDDTDSDGFPVPEWQFNVRSEHNDYITVNWLSLLESISRL